MLFINKTKLQQKRCSWKNKLNIFKLVIRKHFIWNVVREITLHEYICSIVAVMALTSLNGYIQTGSCLVVTDSQAKFHDLWNNKLLTGLYYVIQFIVLKKNKLQILVLPKKNGKEYCSPMVYIPKMCNHGWQF